MSRQAGSIVRDLMPRRISVRTGRQQVLLSTVGGPEGQGIAPPGLDPPLGQKETKTTRTGTWWAIFRPPDVIVV